MRLTTLTLALVAGICTLAIAGDAPVPWTFDFDHIAPKRVSIDDPVHGKVAYWYITYTVKNPHDDAKMLRPEFEIITKEGKRYLDNYYPAAQRLAQLRDKRKYLNCLEVRGLLKPGQTKHGIALFRQIHRDTNYFSLYVSGLSAVKVLEVNGERAKVKVKVFRADYFWGGDRYHFDPENFKLQRTEWEQKTKTLKLQVPLKTE